jgi:chemotaxis family two-component system response regulator Rcp1
MSQARDKKIDILLVEDNPGDVRLIKELLKESKLKYQIRVASDGAEAIQALYENGWPRLPLPDLILLDLKLPQVSGHKVLARIKGDAMLSRIPVIVLTSSSNEEDVATAYGLHANCYITKPMGLDQYNDFIRSLEDFWLRVATLPSFPHGDRDNRRI